MSDNPIFQEAKKFIVAQDKEKVAEITKKFIADGGDPMEIMNNAFIPGINEVGDLFGRGQLFLPELMLSADAMLIATELVNGALEGTANAQKSGGTIVLATVKGDVHDIGKNIVGALLNANGFEVIDMGRDVPALSIVEKAEEVKADIIGLSALLSTTLPYCRDTAKLLEDNGIRDKYHVFIGGGAATPKFAESIRCEYGGEHASAAVEKIKKIMGSV